MYELFRAGESEFVTDTVEEITGRGPRSAQSAVSAGMLSMYFRNDAMTQDDGVRPSQDGTPLAKDLWLAAIAAALIDSKKSRRK